MKINFARGPIVLLLCLTGYAAQGQVVLNAAPPVAVRHTGRVKTVNTARFRRQIVQQHAVFDEEPENPQMVGWRQNWTVPWDTMPLGGLLNESRVQTGVRYPGISGTGFHPPDPDIAVGPNNIIVTVNSSLAIYRKSDGVNLFQQSFNSFFSQPASQFLFDPKCFYDRSIGRFVMVCLLKDTTNQVSQILLAVSATSNPIGNWSTIALDASRTVGATRYWLDYPGVGYDGDAFVFTGNMFPYTSDGPVGVNFLVVPKTAFISGGSVGYYILFDNSAFGVQMCEMIAPASNLVYGVSTYTNNQLKMHAVQNTAGVPTLTSALVTVPSFTYPSAQSTSTNRRTLDALDGRIFTAEWRNGSLVASHDVRIAASADNRVRWYELNTGNWPAAGSVSVAQSGEIIGGFAGESYFLGAVNRDGLGEMSILCTRSSGNATADITITGRWASDGAGLMGIPIVLEGSVKDYQSAGGNRWGDYFGVDVDPADDTTFWGVGMDAGADGDWRTSFFSWTIGAGHSFYVDKNYTGAVELGSYAQPYRTVQKALNAASATQQTNIYIRNGSYNEQSLIMKPVRLILWGTSGNAVVGKP